MVELFKNWISAILFIGIIAAFLQLIIPNSKFNKYIYSLIGVVIVITVISPIISLFKGNNVEKNINDAITTISNEIKQNGDTSVTASSDTNMQKELVKQGFLDSLKTDVKSRLATINISVEDIYIFLDEQYNITSMQIKVNKSSQDSDWLKSVNKIIDYINQEYDIDYSRISVIEKGG